MTSDAGDRERMIPRRADPRGRSRLDRVCVRAVLEASAVANPQSLAKLEHLAASRLATTRQVS